MDVVETKLLRIEAGTRLAFAREHTGSVEGIQPRSREIAKMDAPDPADRRPRVATGHGDDIGSGDTAEEIGVKVYG
jgi:hypothetical protein